MDVPSDTIRVMRILKRGQFRSIRERSFFSFSSFRGFHTAWVLTGPSPVFEMNREKTLEKSSGNGCTFSLVSAETLSHGGNR
jgi:hypothetical protein